MAKYYNKMTGPLPLSLRSGKTGSLPPKRWTHIDREDEGSEMLVRYLKKGKLVREWLPEEKFPKNEPKSELKVTKRSHSSTKKELEKEDKLEVSSKKENKVETESSKPTRRRKKSES